MKKVIISDWTDINRARKNGSYYGCCDSGTYVYYEFYTRRPDGRYELRYSCSADFEYCPVFGQFQRCEDCWSYYDDGDCKAQPKVVTEEKLEQIISNVSNNPDLEVEIVDED